MKKQSNSCHGEELARRHAAAKYLYAELEETGIDDTDFRILEVLVNPGKPCRESRRSTRPCRVTWPKGNELIAPIFRKHAAEIRRVFADASRKELRVLEATPKKIDKRAESLRSRVNPTPLRQQ